MDNNSNISVSWTTTSELPKGIQGNGADGERPPFFWFGGNIRRLCCWSRGILVSVGTAITPERRGCFIATIMKVKIGKNNCFAVLQASRMAWFIGKKKKSVIWRYHNSFPAILCRKKQSAYQVLFSTFTTCWKQGGEENNSYKHFWISRKFFFQ